MGFDFSQRNLIRGSEMELQIFSKNMELTPAIQNYVQKKVGRLARYLPSITEAKVEIHEENTRSPQSRFVAQATLSSKGVLLRGEERGERVRVAVDAVAGGLERQIGRYKGKLYEKGRGISLTRQGAASEEKGALEADDDWPKGVEVKA